MNIELFENKRQAIHYALWMNFKYRLAKIKFGVIYGPEDNWAVVEEATANEMETAFLDVLPENLSKMSYKGVRHFKMDKRPLLHLEQIFGIFSTVDGELLRFLIVTKFPLEKLIRDELASRGYDENNRWCGFDKADTIWRK